VFAHALPWRDCKKDKKLVNFKALKESNIITGSDYLDALLSATRE
jgi:hypothetical protein